jgi:DNA-binding CsgD family transcriptional regulator
MAAPPPSRKPEPPWFDARTEGRPPAPGVAHRAAGGAILGRQGELSRLVAVLRADGSAVVVGEAGIGKTTLLHAAVEATGRRGVAFGGLETLARRPFGALRQLLGAGMEGDAAYIAAMIESRVGPDVLVVDDVQWLDPSTRAAVQELAGRVTIVAAVRTGTAGSEAALALAGACGCERVDIGPLDPVTSLALLREARPELSEPEALRVASRAGGNPFFLLELAGSGSPSVGADVVIRRRLAELGQNARLCAERLAVLGRPATDHELGAGVDELVASGIADRVGNGISFHHQLIAEAVHDGLTPPELASRRLEVARATDDPLEAARLFMTAGATRDASAAAEVAQAQATSHGDRLEALRLRAAATSGPGAVDLRIDAAAALIEVHAYREAAALLEGLAGASARSAVRLAAMRGRIAGVIGDVEEARRILDRAVDEARALVGQGDIEANALLVDALASDAQVRAWSGDPIASLAMAAESVALGDSAGLPAARARTLYGYLLIANDRPGEAVRHLRAAVSSRRASGDGAGELQALNVLLLAEMSSEGVSKALETCRQLDQRAGAMHLLANQMAYRPYLVFLLDAAGRYGEALAVAEELASSLSARAAIYGPAYAALVHGRVGRFEAARAMLARLEERRRADPEAERLYLDTAGTIESAAGRAAHALQLFERCVAMAHKAESDRLEPALGAMWARWDLGRDPGLSLDPGANPRVAGVGPESIGLTLLYSGRYTEACASFDAAADAWDPFLAWAADRCRWAAGEALRLEGSTDAAVERLLTAERVAIERNARPQVARIQRSLRLLGVRRAAPRAAVAGALLTARERELMTLVASGHNNVEIGRRLGLGRGTVHRLMSSAMGKLGARTRSQAVALLEEP